MKKLLLSIILVISLLGSVVCGFTATSAKSCKPVVKKQTITAKNKKPSKSSKAPSKKTEKKAVPKPAPKPAPKSQGG